MANGGATDRAPSAEDIKDAVSLANDQASAFIGLAFAVYSPQIALLVSLLISPPHSIPLPFGRIHIGPLPLAGLAAALLLLFDDVVVMAFASAALTRYEVIFAARKWPVPVLQGALSPNDWSQKAVSVVADWENALISFSGRFVIAVLVMVLFLGISSGYCLWLIWVAT